MDRLYWYLVGSSLSLVKNSVVKVGPPLTKFPGSAHGYNGHLPSLKWLSTDVSLTTNWRRNRLTVEWDISSSGRFRKAHLENNFRLLLPGR